ncbi:aminoglycoside phosphotransferase family protein [Brachybacterium hainanense]|uniref:Aminoglycoside phosphotransferase family protein n=1 Tax=Brachybacterium hainanense TaxID=1541174 RepID=A0ABV6RCM6_9MICO
MTHGTSAEPLLPAHPFLPPGFAPLREEGWTLPRAWPRSADHLLLDLRDPAGSAVAGQWFSDPERARAIAEATPGAERAGRIVLQRAGADRRLRPLAELLAAPGRRLVAHRPERRAVVQAGDRFLKLVRPGRLEEVRSQALLAAQLGVGAPEVLDADPATGSLTTRAVPGTPLTSVLSSSAALAGCRTAGAMIARLQQQGPRVLPGTLAEHDGADELAVVRRWQTLAERFTGLAPPRERPELPVLGSPVLVHRDLHDGQLILDGERAGLLDFDLAALGHPALDLANLLVHLELRSEQGLLADPAAATEAVLEGARAPAPVREAIPAFAEITRHRLRAVYAFRDPDALT